MLGATIRAALVGAFAGLSAAFLAEILSPLIGFMGHPDHWLVAAFQSVNEHAIVVMVASGLVTFVAAAIVEGGLP